KTRSGQPARRQESASRQSDRASSRSPIAVEHFVSVNFKIWSAAPTGFLPRDECARPAAGRLAPSAHWRESRDTGNRLRTVTARADRGEQPEEWHRVATTW